MSQQVLKKFLIDLSKSKSKRDAFRADPEGVMAPLDLTDEEKEALRQALHAGGQLTAAQEKLAQLQGSPKLGGDDNDAVVGEFLDRPKRRKTVERGKKPAKKPAKKKTAKKKK